MGDQPTTPPPAEPAAEDTVIPAPVKALELVEHPDVFTALAAAQAEFPRIPKSHTATVTGKDGRAGYTYSYADLGDVLAATRPILARHGLALVQRTKYREGGGKLELLTEVHHGITGGRIDSELELAQSPGAHQAFGGALTYLRRYEAVTLLGVAAEEDLDGANVDPVSTTAAPAAPELPAWAKPVGGDKRRELIETLERLLGRERATRFVDNVAGSYGGLPAAVVGACRSLARGIVEELDPLALDDAEERRTAAKAAAAQDAAAEAGDPPAPEPAADPPPAEPVDEEAAAITAAAEAGIDVSDLDREPTAAAPASVQPPEIATAANASPVRRIEVLRAAGCICRSPLEEDGKDDRCPIIGHGIPF